MTFTEFLSPILLIAVLAGISVAGYFKRQVTGPPLYRPPVVTIVVALLVCGPALFSTSSVRGGGVIFLGFFLLWLVLHRHFYLKWIALTDRFWQALFQRVGRGG